MFYFDDSYNYTPKNTLVFKSKEVTYGSVNDPVYPSHVN